MKWTGNPAARDLPEGDDCEGGHIVVVGVKLDPRSRELLTWALVKVAQPGDRVIALHVIDGLCEGTAALLSLVKTFNSVLSVYEGFCNLKQVDLKLKVCRGSKVRKILVQETKSYGEATVVVGTSKACKIGSSASVAKYCARKLSKNYSVFAVNNGKVVFQREATSANAESRGKANLVGFHRCLEEPRSALTKKNCSSCALDVGNGGTQSTEELPRDAGVDNSLALVPYRPSEADAKSSSIVIREPPDSKSGWSILRRTIQAKRQYVEKSLKVTSVFHWVSRLPSWQSSAVVYPDQKKSNSEQEDDNCSSLDEDSGAIVPVGSASSCPPLSPCNGLASLPKELLALREKYSSNCIIFSYQDLLLATTNFAPENMIGMGGNSHVYRGYFPDGKELAVKILKPSEDVLKEFVQEIEIITTLHHKNIISLVGFCLEDNTLILVYNFLSRGSLEENLHGNKRGDKAFGWQERYEVAMGVAEALDVLHNSSVEPVIHRDVKSSNILLSDDFEPQLSDFGLACRASTSSNIICTDVAGTFGYLAPEYFMHGKVSDKLDVYAFGVVLLELLSGRKPITSEGPKGSESLIIWAKPILNSGKVSQLLDPSLSSNYDHDQIERMVLAATLCIRREPRLRPQISLVLKLLQGDEEVTMWAKQQLCASELDALDGEAFCNNIKSHLNVALLDLEDDSISIGSSEQNVAIEDYLQARWSRSSSFD